MIVKSALIASREIYDFGIYHHTQGKDKDYALLVALWNFIRLCPLGVSIEINLITKSH